MTRREFLKGAAMVAAVPTGMARAQTPEAVRLHVFSKSLG
ncbi:MAG TPA: twin-arginine translocation signal domain-containing protein, partial [Lentisphaerae bacterium]|nr:twin-arginine translocation signal domain-containing protein [Lentisphaerota bacterium]